MPHSHLAHHRRGFQLAKIGTPPFTSESRLARVHRGRQLVSPDDAVADHSSGASRRMTSQSHRFGTALRSANGYTRSQSRHFECVRARVLNTRCVRPRQLTSDSRVHIRSVSASRPGVCDLPILLRRRQGEAGVVAARTQVLQAGRKHAGVPRPPRQSDKRLGVILSFASPRPSAGGRVLGPEGTGTIWPRHRKGCSANHRDPGGPPSDCRRTVGTFRGFGAWAATHSRHGRGCCAGSRR